ncbi:unnamed protein product [Amoebophrya sp. A120]|nr:unnamed protein product [Amoebophrya sp. A120]|eukprot:GSA120T00023652001.1
MLTLKHIMPLSQRPRNPRDERVLRTLLVRLARVGTGLFGAFFYSSTSHTMISSGPPHFVKAEPTTTAASQMKSSSAAAAAPTKATSFELPTFFTCDHIPEWRNFRKLWLHFRFNTKMGRDFVENGIFTEQMRDSAEFYDVFTSANDLGRRWEQQFTTAVNSWDWFSICEAFVEYETVGRPQKILKLDPEVANFCHYGFMTTQYIGMKVGNTLLDTIAGISNWGRVARQGLVTSLTYNSLNFAEDSGWGLSLWDYIKAAYNLQKQSGGFVSLAKNAGTTASSQSTDETSSSEDLRIHIEKSLEDEIAKWRKKQNQRTPVHKLAPLPAKKIWSTTSTSEDGDSLLDGSWRGIIDLLLQSEVVVSGLSTTSAGAGLTAARRSADPLTAIFGVSAQDLAPSPYFHPPGDQTSRPEVAATSLLEQEHLVPTRPSLKVLAVGYHVSLAREPLETFAHLLDLDKYLKRAIHVLDAGATSVEDLKKKSHCRFNSPEWCTKNEEFIVAMNAELQVRRYGFASKLPILQSLENWQEVFEQFKWDLVEPFDLDVVPRTKGQTTTTPPAGDRNTATGKTESLSSRRRSALYPDVLLCGEPLVLCRVMHLAFPRASLVSYSAQQITMYVDEPKLAQQVLREYLQLAQLPHSLFVTSGRIVSEWYRFQAGIPAIPITPNAVYLNGAFYHGMKSRRILLLRQVSLFWDPECILNYFLRQVDWWQAEEPDKKFGADEAIGMVLGRDASGEQVADEEVLYRLGSLLIRKEQDINDGGRIVLDLPAMGVADPSSVLLGTSVSSQEASERQDPGAADRYFAEKVFERKPYSDSEDFLQEMSDMAMRYWRVVDKNGRLIGEPDHDRGRDEAETQEKHLPQDGEFDEEGARTREREARTDLPETATQTTFDLLKLSHDESNSNLSPFPHGRNYTLEILTEQAIRMLSIEGQIPDHVAALGKGYDDMSRGLGENDESFSRVMFHGRKLYEKSGFRDFVYGDEAKVGERNQRGAASKVLSMTEGNSDECDKASAGAKRTGPATASCSWRSGSSRSVAPTPTSSALFSPSSYRNPPTFEFVESTSLSKSNSADYQSFGAFKAVVMFPYAYTQFWFFELYHIGVPIFLPEKRTLPLYVGQDFIRFQFYVISDQVPCRGAADQENNDDVPPAPAAASHEYHPFLEHANLRAFLYWVQFCEWVSWPFITEFDSLRGLVEHFNPNSDSAGKLAQISRKMRQFSQKVTMDNAAKWRTGLAAVLSVPVAERKPITLARKPSTTEISTSGPVAEGSYFFGDLSTHQPCGGSPGRDDSPTQKANDGKILQDHPNEYHTNENYMQPGEDAFWWVQLREHRKVVNVTIWARDCCSEQMMQAAEELRVETSTPEVPEKAQHPTLDLYLSVDSNSLEDAIFCGQVKNIEDGSIRSGLCDVREVVTSETETESQSDHDHERKHTGGRVPDSYDDYKKQLLDEVGGNVLFVVNRAKKRDGIVPPPEPASLMLPEVLVSDVGWVPDRYQMEAGELVVP